MATIACPFFAGPSAAQPLPRSVLILDQYSGSLPWVGARNAAFRTLVNTNRKTSVSIYEEFLDLNRLASQAYKESLTLHFGVKYRDKPIDLIVAFGPLAFDYAIDIRAELWPKIPLVFGEIAETAISRSNLPAATTGTTINITLGELVIAARAVVPDLKRIAIVGDSLDRLPAYRHFKDEIPLLTRDLEYTDLTGLTMTDLRDRVSALPDHTAIIYTTINFDRAGVSFVPAEALSLVAEVANRPIVISTETFLGRGAVGGFVVTPGSVGRDAALLASRILDGGDPSAIAVASSGMNKPVFDWRQLQRWKGDASRLPKDSEIRFRELGIWDQYRGYVLAAIAAILLQGALLSWLMYEHWRRIAAEANSAELTYELTQMNRFATAGEMSASIAHELRQPLAAVVMSGVAALNWLKKQVPDLNQARLALETVVKESHRADDVIKSVRAMFRHESPARAPINLNELIQDVMTITARQINSNNIVLDANLTDNPPPMVMADSVQLKQVILNLIMNAVDAMSQPGHWARILQLGTQVRPDGTVLTRVTDSGPSVDPKVVEKMFQHFFTTKSSGMGMGLSICKTIVEAHGGTLTASPSKPRGMEFRIVLPLAKYG